MRRRGSWTPRRGRARRALRDPARRAAASADRAEARREARPTPWRARSRRRQPRARSAATRNSSAGLRRREQHDLGPPPLPTLIALGLVRDDARRLEIVKPALHALPVRTHEPRPFAAPARNPAPAHHRRQPHDELLDRRRVPPRTGGVPEPEQVALDRVHARLEPIVTRRRAAPAPVARGPADAHTTKRPGSGGRGARAGRYQRRPDAPRRGSDARSSGTANARQQRARG